MSVRLRIAGSDREQRQATSALTPLLRAAKGVEVSRPEDRPPERGEKGATIDLGTLVIALISSGAATALINVLQHYCGRNRSASVSFEAEDGRKMSVSHHNLSADEVEETTRRLAEIFESK